MNWYLQALKKYAVFSGRARRKEYWYFFLFNFIVGLVLGFIDGLVGTSSKGAGIGLLGSIYVLAVFVPGIAVSVRRLHDTNRSGWWLLIVLIPIIGAIILLVFMMQGSRKDENRYGPNPTAAEFCRECGKEIDDNAAVCAHCGASIQRSET
ncbi:MAG: DUF805 domain-containing protein [Syntrophorhabdaceae bacterium]|jgi:uncharacterized membrane protein YhaH (DUF805 family)|nr:DUF805 domain-containing protein [Syntrophorhabdaceae bacterium]MDD5245743.1 DUF805 domain-containing protein [Syntrophorhabdaceae bacterium]